MVVVSGVDIFSCLIVGSHTCHAHDAYRCVNIHYLEILQIHLRLIIKCKKEENMREEECQVCTTQIHCSGLEYNILQSGRITLGF